MKMIPCKYDSISMPCSVLLKQMFSVCDAINKRMKQFLSNRNVDNFKITFAKPFCSCIGAWPIHDHSDPRLLNLNINLTTFAPWDYNMAAHGSQAILFSSNNIAEDFCHSHNAPLRVLAERNNINWMKRIENNNSLKFSLIYYVCSISLISRYVNK